jgi:methyltransferase (TIGR00027 family)
MQNSASKTALATAYLRAAHQFLDGRPLVLDDPIAIPLLGMETEAHIKDAKEKYMSPEAKALRAHVVLRSRYAEDRLRAAIDRGVFQYVILGAGFDTFALRKPNWADHLAIIEIDHPDTQALKKSKIKDAGLQVPDNLKFIAVDFEHESICAALSRAELDLKQPIFFSWLGVTMYLTNEAITTTLKAMAATPKGSEVVLTFLQNTKAESTDAQALANRVAEVGEPFISYFTPEEVAENLLSCGFNKTHLLTAEESSPLFSAQTNYLANPKWPSIISATV